MNSSVADRRSNLRSAVIDLSCVCCSGVETGNDMMVSFPLKMRYKLISGMLSHLLVCRGQRHSEAQVLEPPDGPALGRFENLFLGVARSQFAVGLLFFEQVIDDDQDAMGQ